MVELIEAITIEKNNIKSILSLDNVNNTADINKPITTAVINALSNKQNLLTLASVEEMQTGSETAIRAVSPSLVKSAINSLIVSEVPDLVQVLNDKQDTLIPATQNEMEVGTESGARAISPLRVKQAITALGGLPELPTGLTDKPVILAYNPISGEYFWWDFYSAITSIPIQNSDVNDVKIWLDFSDITRLSLSDGKIIHAYNKNPNFYMDFTSGISHFPFYIANAYNGLNVYRNPIEDDRYLENINNIEGFDFTESTVFVASVRTSNKPLNNLLSIRYKYALLYQYYGTQASRLCLSHYNGENSDLILNIPDGEAGDTIDVAMAKTSSDGNSMLKFNYRYQITGYTGIGSNLPLDAKFVLGLNTNYYNNTQGADIDIGEVLIFPVALDETRIQRIEGYLAHKWGSASKLPSNHPWKLAPPFV